MQMQVGKLVIMLATQPQKCLCIRMPPSARKQDEHCLLESDTIGQGNLYLFYLFYFLKNNLFKVYAVLPRTIIDLNQLCKI